MLRYHSMKQFKTKIKQRETVFPNRRKTNQQEEKDRFRTYREPYSPLLCSFLLFYPFSCPPWHFHVISSPLQSSSFFFFTFPFSSPSFFSHLFSSLNPANLNHSFLLTTLTAFLFSSLLFSKFYSRLLLHYYPSLHMSFFFSFPSSTIMFTQDTLILPIIILHARLPLPPPQAYSKTHKHTHTHPTHTHTHTLPTYQFCNIFFVTQYRMVTVKKWHQSVLF